MVITVTMEMPMDTIRTTQVTPMGMTRTIQEMPTDMKMAITAMEATQNPAGDTNIRETTWR